MPRRTDRNSSAEEEVECASYGDRGTITSSARTAATRSWPTAFPLDDQGGDDIVRALAGDDTVRGFGGDNYIDGGPGNDTLTTADGRDQIYGGGGADDVQSGRGADVVHGGAGNDALHGGEGDDLLYGEAGADRVVGSSDNDTLYGGMGSDTLEGRDGQDTFAWSAANEGKDTIVDLPLGADHFRLGSFLTGFDGSEAKLERFVRFMPESGGAASVLQVDIDGPASGGWRALALARGSARPSCPSALPSRRSVDRRPVTRGAIRPSGLHRELRRSHSCVRGQRRRGQAALSRLWLR